MASPKNYKIAAVDRALIVLEALGEQPGQGVTALANSLGMTKTIVFRILQTLEDRGFVYRDPDRAVYSLGYRLGILGEHVGQDGSLLFAARPVMDALLEQTSENVNLVVREGLNTLALATRSGRHSIRLFAQSGRRGPLYAGGGSQVLLAYAGDEVLEDLLSRPLKRYTPYTIVEPDRLREVLCRIRKNGYNVSLNDLDEGAFSIAAPIRGGNGEVFAAISVAGAVVRYTEERGETYLAAVQAAAQDISDKLTLDTTRGEDKPAA